MVRGQMLRPTDELKIAGRWELIGDPAPESVRSLYVNGKVAAYFKHGQQNPVVYVNV